MSGPSYAADQAWAIDPASYEDCENDDDTRTEEERELDDAVAQAEINDDLDAMYAMQQGQVWRDADWAALETQYVAACTMDNPPW